MIVLDSIWSLKLHLFKWNFTSCSAFEIWLAYNKFLLRLLSGNLLVHLGINKKMKIFGSQRRRCGGGNTHRGRGAAILVAAHYSSHDSRDHPSTFKTTAFAFRWLPHHYHHLVFDDYQASLRWIKILITGASTLLYLLAPRSICRERWCCISNSA